MKNNMLCPFFSVCLHALISGIYAGLIHSTLSIFIYEQYKSISKTTLLNAAFYPGDLKMFWLPFLDNININFFNFGIKKNLIIIFDTLILLIFLVLSFVDFSNYSFWLFLLYLSIFGIIMSARDSITIGYKLEFFNKDELWQYEGKINACYTMGICFGGCCILLLSTIYSWQFLFQSLNILFLINLILNFFTSNSIKYENKKYKSIIEKFYLPYKDLVAKKIFFVLIGFSITYTISSKLILGIIQPFLLDLGFSKASLSTFKIIAALITSVSVACSTCITNFFGKENSILFSLILYIIMPFLFILSILTNHTQIALYLCLLEKIFRGIQGNFSFLAKSQCLKGEYAMVQISILSCIEKLSGRLITTSSGYIVDYFKFNSQFFLTYFMLTEKSTGWLYLFIFSFLLVIPSLYFTNLFLKTSVLNEKTSITI